MILQNSSQSDVDCLLLVALHGFFKWNGLMHFCCAVTVYWWMYCHTWRIRSRCHALRTPVKFLLPNWPMECEKNFHIELWPTVQFLQYCILRLTFLNVIQVSGHHPSTERRKCHHLAANNKCCGTVKETLSKTLAPPCGQVWNRITNYLQPFYRPLCL